MNTIVFKGYWGTGNSDPRENEALGLIVGKSYFVVSYHECQAADEDTGTPQCLCPTVSNERGEHTALTHGEYTDSLDDNGGK